MSLFPFIYVILWFVLTLEISRCDSVWLMRWGYRGHWSFPLVSETVHSKGNQLPRVEDTLGISMERNCIPLLTTITSLVATGQSYLGSRPSVPSHLQITAPNILSANPWGTLRLRLVSCAGLNFWPTALWEKGIFTVVWSHHISGNLLHSSRSLITSPS